MHSVLTSKPLRDRALTIITALAVPVVLAWAYLLVVVPQAMAMSSHWGLGHAAIVFIMWAVMMVAMMLPSVAKVALLAAILDGQHRSLPAIRHTGEFAAGYLGVWLAFSLAATAAQWALYGAGLLSATTMTGDGYLFTGSLVLYAGVYQWNPLKEACLTHCRDPQEFLALHLRRDGPFGTGLRHGLFCLGCCWMLMALLFVGDLMNPACMAVIAVAMLAEKTLPLGSWTSRAIGTTLIAGGAATLVAPLWR